MWNYLLETNFLNFLIFAAILLVVQHRLIKQAWSKKNQALTRELEEVQSAKRKAEDELKKAEEEFVLFQQNLSEIKAEHDRIVHDLKETLSKDNQDKLHSLKHKYQREINRILEISEESIRERIIQTAMRISLELFKTNQENQEKFNQKAIQDIIKYKIS